MRRGVCAWVAWAVLFAGVVQGGGGFVLDGISQREPGTASQAYVDTARTGVTGQLRGELGASGRVWRTEWQVAAGASAAVVRAEWRARQDRITQGDMTTWLQVADGLSTLWRAERAVGSGRIEVLAVGDEPGVYNGPPVGTIFSNRVDYAQWWGMDATQLTKSDVPATGGTTVKPGYQTTEFWMTAGATFVGLAMASGAIPETGIWPKLTGLVVAAFTAMGYTISRGMVKRG